MRRRAPVCKIERLSDQVEDVSVAHPVRLWYLGHNWFLWVHISAVINNLPIYGNINTTIQTVNGEVVLVTVSRSIHLLDVGDDWLNIKVCPIWCVSTECVCDTYRPSYFSSRKQDFGRLFCARHLIPSDTFPKKSVQIWYWYNIKAGFKISVECSLISCNFLLFAHNLFIFRLNLVQLFCLTFGQMFLLAIILLFSSFFSKGIFWFSWQYLFLTFCFFCQGILSLSAVMFATCSECKVFWYRYNARPLLTL